MFYTYVLLSLADKDLYIGSTRDLKKRFLEHNSKQTFSTKSRVPFKLVYYEAFLNEQDARDRESALKLRGQARYQLVKRLNKSILQAKG